MSQPATIFDIEDPDAEEQALREAEADVAAGRLVPHSEVAKWLDDLAAGTLRAPPEPWK
jgi:predicted transcriptional regulator